jgi:LEA14-like dessication related protein
MRTEHRMIQRRRALQWMPVIVLIAGCSTLLGQRDPVQVQVVGVEPLDGEGLELRFLCKLRVQNPNDAPIDFNGIYLELEVRGSALASGVSDASGTVPRFGEVVLSVPVTASVFRLARQVFGTYMSSDRSRLDYVLRGKIGGPSFGAVRFESKGELTLPSGAAEIEH